MTPDELRRASRVAWRFALTDALERVTTRGPGDRALGQLTKAEQVAIGILRGILARLLVNLDKDAADGPG